MELIVSERHGCSPNNTKGRPLRDLVTPSLKPPITFLLLHASVVLDEPAASKWVHIPWPQLWLLRGSKQAHALYLWGTGNGRVCSLAPLFWSDHHTFGLNAYSLAGNLRYIDKTSACQSCNQGLRYKASFAQTPTNLQWFRWVLLLQLWRGGQSREQIAFLPH